MTQTPIDILLVDDSPVKILALESSLEPLGQRIHKASSGREALRLLLLHDFAVVLLDVHMPGMDGFETAELIRGRERSAHTPIIFVSAVNQTEAHAFRGYVLGGVDYIFSPFVPEVIRAKVSTFVELHRKTEQARAMAARIADDARVLAASSERLRHAERMASLGTLAAGLGHDMGNLLLPIRFRIEAIESNDLPHLVREDLAAVRKCTDFLQRLAHGLRMLSLDSQDDDATGQETDLRRWCEDFSPVLRSCLPPEVSLETRFEAGPNRVRIAEHRLSQAVFNLVQNAADALRPRARGTVVVWTADAGADCLRLGVTDDGPGMTDEVKRRCLDPFFTTKTRGISTGLGLSLVQAMVAKAGGTLDLTSEPGAGTTFTMTLPRPLTASGHGSAPPAALPRPIATVSVADQRIAGFAGALLASLGWQARAGAGEADTQLWIAEPAQTDAVSLRRFCEQDPHRRIVLIGHGDPSLGGGQIIPTGDAPAPGALRAAIRRAIDDCKTHIQSRAASPERDQAEGATNADPGAVRGRQRVDRRSARKTAPARP